MSTLQLADRLKATLRELGDRPVSASMLKELVRLDALDCVDAGNTPQGFPDQIRAESENELNRLG